MSYLYIGKYTHSLPCISYTHPKHPCIRDRLMFIKIKSWNITEYILLNITFSCWHLASQHSRRFHPIVQSVPSAILQWIRCWAHRWKFSGTVPVLSVHPENANIQPGYFKSARLELLDFNKNKEVFVKHEQAPTAPKLEGVWVFVDLKYIFYENRFFLPILQLSVGCFWPKWSDQDLSFESITKSP